MNNIDFDAIDLTKEAPVTEPKSSGTDRIQGRAG